MGLALFKLREYRGTPAPICPEDILVKSESYPDYKLCTNGYWIKKEFYRTYDKKAIKKEPRLSKTICRGKWRCMRK